MNQFSNIDRPSAPQEVQIEFIRGSVPDTDPDLSFLEQDYSDSPPEEAAKYRAQDAKRLADYNCGEWYMRGMYVEARVSVPIGGGSFTVFALRSVSLWGVESDCGADYENQVWQDEEMSLRAAMRIMGLAFVKLTEGAAVDELAAYRTPEDAELYGADAEQIARDRKAEDVPNED